MFDMVRKEAYRRFHNLKKQGGEMPEFMDVLIRFGMGVNQTFSPPLSHPEVRCVCKSVAKWVFSHFDVARFSAMKRDLVNRRWSKVTTLVSTKPWLELGNSHVGASVATTEGLDFKTGWQGGKPGAVCRTA